MFVQYRQKHKPYTVRDDASLVVWLRCYPFMRLNPRAWFANGHWTQRELAQVHDAGYQAVALALGYRPVQHQYETDTHFHPVSSAKVSEHDLLPIVR